MNNIKDYMDLLLKAMNIVIILYGLYKFLGRPHTNLEERHNTLEKRVDEHDVQIKEVKQSLKEGNDRFREQENTNATFKSVMLAFVNFEIAYCRNTGYKDDQDLLVAKRELSEYLTGKHHEKD